MTVTPMTQDNVMSILILTDNHLGFLEKDPIRKNDSFDTFEEIIKIGVENQVDFIIQGGDLFHDNKPSRHTVYKCMEILRTYCMGDKPCSVIQVISQDSKFGWANYQDPNLNIAFPMFSIHGNHDDPAGDGSLCAMDILAMSGFLNYFGKCDNASQINMHPILLKKGETKLALYGIGNIRDERLNRTFRDGNVKMYRPRQDAEEWFNLFVIHQNRIAHGKNNHIPEEFLDKFLNLVIWGHEHECLIDPQLNPQQEFYVSQPGSSVATTLCEAETVQKHCAILRINKTSFQLEKIPLKTVRPFVMGNFVLEKVPGLKPSDKKGISQCITQKIQALIRESFDEWKERNPDSNNDDFPKPLIRLKVDYTGDYATFNPHQFGQQFVDQIANPKEVVYFYRRKTMVQKSNETISLQLNATTEVINVEDLVTEFLMAQHLDMLPENKVNEAIRLFVEKDDKDAIPDYIDQSLKSAQKLLEAKPIVIMDDDTVIKKELNETKATLTREIMPLKKEKPSQVITFTDDEDEVIISEPTTRRTAKIKKEMMDVDNEVKPKKTRAPRGKAKSTISQKPAIPSDKEDSPQEKPKSRRKLPSSFS